MSTQKKSMYPVSLAAITVTALAAMNWYFAPDRAVLWAGVIFAAIAGMFAATLVNERSSPEAARNIRGSLFAALLIFSSALSLGAANQLGIIDSSFEQRGAGVILGVVLAVTGNFIPKTARPLHQGRCDPARALAAERFTGWSFVFVGIAYISIWLIAPLDWAPLLSLLAGFSAFAVAIAAWLWLISGNTSTKSY